MKILWFDPGGTTGWCTFSCREMPSFNVKNPDVEYIEYLDMEWNAGEIVGEKHYDKIYELIELQFTEPDFTVGYEDFHWQRKEDREATDYNAPRYIGCIETICRVAGDVVDLNPTVVSQLPSERLFVDDTKLKIFGLHTLTRGQKDARAAARHLLTYLTKTLNYPPIIRQLEAVLNK